MSASVSWLVTKLDTDAASATPPDPPALERVVDVSLEVAVMLRLLTLVSKALIPIPA